MNKLYMIMVFGFLTVLIGCSKPSLGSISGKITCDKKNMEGTEVHCYASDGIDYPANLGPDGNYAIHKIPAGECTLVIIQPPSQSETEGAIIKHQGERVNPGKATSAEAAAAAMGVQQRKADPRKYNVTPSGTKTALPVKYADRGTSDAKVVVVAGQDTVFNLELK